MSEELPTREEARESAECCDWHGNSDGHAIVAAYGGGHLHTNDEVREIVERSVERARAEWEAAIDYQAGCEEMQSDSMGWQTCSDDGDLESFRRGVKTAVGISDE